MPLTFLPFDETAANPMTKNFVKYVGKSKLSGFASNGFTAGLLFEQAAKDAVAKHGNNGLTRANLLEALKGTTAFNAGGMVGTQNIGQKIPSPCFMVEQWKGGTFHRVYPNQEGHVRLQAIEPRDVQGRPLRDHLSRCRAAPQT